MKVKQFFKEKYLKFEFVFFEQNENEDTEYYDLDFYIRKGEMVYCGLFTKKEREQIDNFINLYGDRLIDDYDIDKESKQIYIYLR